MFKDKKILITAGPTIEKIDPVRYISNFSSGKQGYAFARAFSKLGAQVHLVSGPTNLAVPEGVILHKVESVEGMLNACYECLPADIAICAAAVCDYRPKEIYQQKMKKEQDIDEISLTLVKNPDILAQISNHKNRPNLVIGFAAETENLIENAKSKLKRKN